MAHSNKADVPAKPRRDFPLTPRGDGRWCKRVRGKLEYFTGSAEEAETEWERVKVALINGLPRPPKGQTVVTLANVINSFLAHKEALRDAGELAPRTFARYEATGRMLAAFFGRDRAADSLAPEDFQRLRTSMAERWGPVALGNEIQTVRSIFAYGVKQELLAKPARFGAGFEKPSEKVLRQTRASSGPQMFSPEQIHKLLKVAGPRMQAMILLAINGGLGNGDIGSLPLALCDGKSEWLEYPRAKTAIPRRIPLWAETCEAVRKSIEKRPKPKTENDAALLFIGGRGRSYESNKGYRVTAEFIRLAKEAGIEGRSFYDFRRSFETIAEAGRDLSAVQSIMGHAPPANDMSARYRQRVDDERLLAVVQVVHDWLFAKPAKGSTGTAATKGKAPAKPRKSKPELRKPRASAEVFQLRIVG